MYVYCQYNSKSVCTMHFLNNLHAQLLEHWVFGSILFYSPTLNNMRSVSLVEETGEPRKNHKLHHIMLYRAHLT